MSKKRKDVKFGIEALMRLGVFAVILAISIGYLSNSKSNINIPTIDPNVLGDYSPKIVAAQNWVQTEFKKFQSQALDQIFEKIKTSLLK